MHIAPRTNYSASVMVSTLIAVDIRSVFTRKFSVTGKSHQEPNRQVTVKPFNSRKRSDLTNGHKNQPQNGTPVA